MKSSKIVTILLPLCWIAFKMQGNTVPASLPDAEARLNNLFSAISPEKSDSEKLQLADTILCTLDSILQLPGSFDYPFDQLKATGKITSPNQKVRIFTWNLPLQDGTNKFFGFILHKTGNGNISNVYRLTDRSDSITNPALATLTADNWYGCLIYVIVEKKISGDTYYTLLGYHPENLFITRKLADILWFNDKNEPVFGKALFHYDKRMQCRILFEYSAKVQMSLMWNEKMNMIVFDHLSPLKSSYTGNYQYYGPDFSYDGLMFEKGVWETVQDIDVRNSKE
jgi:hypothetical protein